VREGRVPSISIGKRDTTRFACTVLTLALIGVKWWLVLCQATRSRIMDFLPNQRLHSSPCSTTGDLVHCRFKRSRLYCPRSLQHALSTETSPPISARHFASHASDHHGRRHTGARSADCSAGHRAPSSRPRQHHARWHSTYSWRREGGCRGAQLRRRCAQPGARVLHELSQAAVRARLAIAGAGCRICRRKLGCDYRQYVSTVSCRETRIGGCLGSCSLTIRRACSDCLELGRSNLVWCICCFIPSVPVLPK
jgi:hypothetical protein